MQAVVENNAVLY